MLDVLNLTWWLKALVCVRHVMMSPDFSDTR